MVDVRARRLLRHLGPAGPLVTTLAGLAALAPTPALALADLPDSQGILVPGDRPSEIVVATTFGIVVSEDGGRTWTWTCDQQISAEAKNYQLGPPPPRRLYATTGQLLYSDDASCSWQVATSPLATIVGGALFIDPANATRVLSAAGVPAADGGSNTVVLESANGGASFDLLRYGARPGEVVTGIGAAGAGRATLYLTVRSGAIATSTLLRSDDGGVGWQPVAVDDVVGRGELTLIAGDRSGADRVFLRHRPGAADGGAPTGDEALAIATGTAIVTTPVVFTGGQMTGFVQATDGTLLVSGLVGQAPALFRSDDRGATFSPLSAPPHIHALAERAGVIYAATGAWDDGFVMETSPDRGATWQPALSFDDVQAISACGRTICQIPCAYAVSVGLWSASVCSAEPPTGDAGAPSDAATPSDAARPDGAGAAAGAGADGGAGAGAGGAAGAAGSSGLVGRPSGCHCGLASDGAWPGTSAAALLLTVGWVRRRRRAR